MTTWLEHVKKVHASGSTSFKESLKRASASWKKSKGGATKTAAPKAARKGKRKKKKKCTECEEEHSTDVQAAPKPFTFPKKKRRRAKKSMPKIPAKSFKDIDSINM